MGPHVRKRGAWIRFDNRLRLRVGFVCDEGNAEILSFRHACAKVNAAAVFVQILVS